MFIVVWMEAAASVPAALSSELRSRPATNGTCGVDENPLAVRCGHTLPAPQARCRTARRTRDHLKQYDRDQESSQTNKALVENHKLVAVCQQSNLPVPEDGQVCNELNMK